MKGIAPSVLSFLLFYLISSVSWAQNIKTDTLEKRSNTDSIHKNNILKDAISREAIRKDSIRNDSIRRDTIPQYIIISDTVRTYPFTQDSLNKINIRVLRRNNSHQKVTVQAEQVARDYCLYKPKYWSKSIDASLNLTEATFSRNWKAGGLNSLAALATLNAKTDYERYDVSFTNELQSQYGSAEQTAHGLRKTADRLYLDSKFAVKIKNPFYLFTAVNFQSQFAAGYNYNDGVFPSQETKISGFLAPGYLTESLGLEFKPKPYFSLRLGVGAFRQTFVIDTSIHKNTQNNYGVPIGERSLTEAAFQLVANFDKEIGKNVHLKTLFQFFESYVNSANTSTRLDVSLTTKVNRMLNVNFTATALYDHNQDPRIQFTQFLSLGLSYRFSDFSQ